MMFPLVVAPGLTTDDTAMIAHPVQTYGAPPPGYIDMDKARFWRGQPQSIGGWETFVGTALTGVCRNLLPWDDLAGTLNCAFGTNTSLFVYVGGVLYDITPTLALPPVILGANPFATTAASAVVTVTQPGHPYIVGESVIVTGASAVSTVTMNGTWTVLAVTTNAWTFTAGSAAAGIATGGGSAVRLDPQRPYTVGAVDGTGGSGFGTGTYGTGGYSQPSTVDYFPRTWSLANYGQTLIACPRGGTIYQWNNDTGTRAQPILNAPAKVTYAMVTPQRQVVALGCNSALSGLYDPMNARGSDLEDPTTWLPTSTNNAWEERLEGGGRLVAGHMLGDLIGVWSDTCFWQAQFVGDPGQTYRLTRLGDNCGLIGPNAAEVIGQTAYWMAPDGNFRTCALNGEPNIIPCPVSTGVYQNLAPAQQDKIICAEIPKFSEVWWFYPDARDGNDVSRYVGVSTITGLWFHGTFDRTAFHAGGPAPYPIATNYAGNIYYHEKGQTADGAVLTGFWETGAQYVGDADQRFQIKGVYPDFQEQVGPASMTVYGRAYPQGTDRAKGPFMLAANQSKRDFLCDARLVRVRVAFNSSPAFLRQGRIMFNADASGMQ